MKKNDYTVRLVVRPSQLDPGRAKVQASLRLSDGRRIYFTSKGSVDTFLAKNLFDTTGRPYDVERYDKSTYRIMRGLYTSIVEAMMDLLCIDSSVKVTDLSTDEIRGKVEEYLNVWNRNHSEEGGNV